MPLFALQLRKLALPLRCAPVKHPTLAVTPDRNKPPNRDRRIDRLSQPRPVVVVVVVHRSLLSMHLCPEQEVAMHTVAAVATQLDCVGGHALPAVTPQRRTADAERVSGNRSEGGDTRLNDDQIVTVLIEHGRAAVATFTDTHGHSSGALFRLTEPRHPRLGETGLPALARTSRQMCQRSPNRSSRSRPRKSDSAGKKRLR